MLATHGSVPGKGKAAGRPLILQGSYPAGAPGGAWSKVQAPILGSATSAKNQMLDVRTGVPGDRKNPRQASCDDSKKIERFRLNL